MKQYRIGYSSHAGTADLYTNISNSDISVLYDYVQTFPIEDTYVKDLLPELHQRLLAECQHQEDECIKDGIYNVEEYEDFQPEDFHVYTYYIFD